MKTMTLTNSNIEQAVETVSTFLKKYKVEQKNILRLTLALEDTLLNYRDTFSEEAVFELKCVHHFGKLRIELELNGDCYDPFAGDDEEDFSRLLLSGVGLAPTWQYKNGQNLIIFTPEKKKPSQLVYMVAAVILAVICGALSGFLPETVQTLLSERVFASIFDTFLGLLNAVAGIMVFLSVVWGICSIGDITTLTSIGKNMISRMLLLMVTLPTIYALCVLPLFHFTDGDGVGTMNLTGPFSMILGIIPSNLVAPFVEGNFLQIVFIAAIVGIGLLVMGGKASALTNVVEQANHLIQLILEVLCSFISIAIFCSIYNMIMAGDFTVLIGAYKMPLLVCLGCLAAMCLYTCWICISKRVKPTVLLRKIAPSFLIALTTASSSAALSTIMETCEKQHGVDRKIINFGVPLGRILFGIGSVIEFIVMGFCMAEIYHVAVTPAWIIMTIITAVILKIATPPIPGGSVALCTILFNQLGIPLEGLTVAVAVDVVVDFVLTATDVFLLQSELIMLSGRLHMLDVEKLRRKKNG